MSQELYELGKSMKEYVKAILITIIISVVAVVVFFASIFSMTDSGSEYGSDPYSSASSIIALFGLIILVLFVVGIYTFVKYVQYLSKLKNAGRNDPDLASSYSLQLWGLILSFLIPVILFFAFIGTIITFVESDYGSSSGFYGSIYIVQMLMFLMIIPSILNSVAMFKFGNWAERLPFGDPRISKIKDGANLMKWGYLIGIFISLGLLAYYIGMYQAGKAMEELFGTPGAPSVTSFYGAQPQITGQTQYSQTVPGYQNTVNPNLSYPNTNLQNPNQGSFGTYMPPNSPSGAPTSMPQGNVSGLRCKVCGELIQEPGAKFCKYCGSPLN